MSMFNKFKSIALASAMALGLSGGAASAAVTGFSDVEIASTVSLAGSGVFTPGPNLFTGGTGVIILSAQISVPGTLAVTDLSGLFPMQTLAGTFIASQTSGTAFEGLFQTNGPTIYTGLEDFFVISIFDNPDPLLVDTYEIRGATAMAPVPLPAGAVLLLSGLVGLRAAGARRKRLAQQG